MISTTQYIPVPKMEGNGGPILSILEGLDIFFQSWMEMAHFPI